MGSAAWRRREPIRDAVVSVPPGQSTSGGLAHERTANGTGCGGLTRRVGARRLRGRNLRGRTRLASCHARGGGNCRSTGDDGSHCCADTNRDLSQTGHAGGYRHANGDSDHHASGDGDHHANGDGDHHANGDGDHHANGDGDHHANGDGDHHANGDGDHHANGDGDGDHHANGDGDHHANGDGDRPPRQRRRRPPRQRRRRPPRQRRRSGPHRQTHPLRSGRLWSRSTRRRRAGITTQTGSPTSRLASGTASRPTPVASSLN